MKKIRVVAENAVDAKSKLEKSMIFSTEHTQVVFFDKGEAANIQKTVRDVTDKRCKSEMITDFWDSSPSLSETMFQIVKQLMPDVVAVNRPKVESKKQESSMLKAVLKSTAQSTFLLCGNNKWKDVKTNLKEIIKAKRKLLPSSTYLCIGGRN